MKPHELLLLLCFLACPLTLVVGQQTVPPPPRNASQLICVPFGTCEPCPEDALKQPFCQPFGNRRLMHCTPSLSSTFSNIPGPHHVRPPSPHLPAGVSVSSSPPPSLRPVAQDVHIGEIPAWESCGRIVEKERGDFFEFVACNFGLALAAIGIVLVRSKQLQAMQARQLAARIGLVRQVPGGWVG